MTEMEEIKTMLADINKKLDRVIFQNKIALNTKYGLPFKQEMEESCCKKFREVKHEAVKEFAEKLKEICVRKRQFIDIDDKEEYYFDGAVTIEEIDKLLKEYEVEE